MQNTGPPLSDESCGKRLVKVSSHPALRWSVSSVLGAPSCVDVSWQAADDQGLLSPFGRELHPGGLLPAAGLVEIGDGQVARVVCPGAGGVLAGGAAGPRLGRTRCRSGRVGGGRQDRWWPVLGVGESETRRRAGAGGRWCPGAAAGPTRISGSRLWPLTPAGNSSQYREISRPRETTDFSHWGPLRYPAIAAPGTRSIATSLQRENRRRSSSGVMPVPGMGVWGAPTITNPAPAAAAYVTPATYPARRSGPRLWKHPKSTNSPYPLPEVHFIQPPDVPGNPAHRDTRPFGGPARRLRQRARLRRRSQPARRRLR
jgi:hypothetical protein